MEIIFFEGSIYIKDKIFKMVDRSSKPTEPLDEEQEIIDGKGMYAIPGFLHAQIPK